MITINFYGTADQVKLLNDLVHGFNTSANSDGFSGEDQSYNTYGRVSVKAHEGEVVERLKNAGATVYRDEFTRGKKTFTELAARF